MPWSAVQRWRKTDRILAEEVCAENNFSYFNFEVAHSAGGQAGLLKNAGKRIGRSWRNICPKD
jgi:hypothetical protein